MESGQRSPRRVGLEDKGSRDQCKGSRHLRIVLGFRMCGHGRVGADLERQGKCGCGLVGAVLAGVHEGERLPRHLLRGVRDGRSLEGSA